MGVHTTVLRDGRVIANVAWALSPSPPWHCAGVFANITLAVPLLHWHCHRHCAGTFTFIALAHRCHRCCCVCVFATVALPSSPSHRPNVVVMGGRCWHRTDTVALASAPSHGRHCQRCTGAVAIILLASCWHFFPTSPSRVASLPSLHWRCHHRAGINTVAGRRCQCCTCIVAVLAPYQRQV